MFDKVYLIDVGTDSCGEALTAAVDTLATYLDVNTATAAGGFAGRCRAERDDSISDTAALKTFAIAKIDDDDLATADQVAHDLVVRALEAWLRPVCDEWDATPTTDSRADAAEIAAQIAADLHFDFDGFLATLEAAQRPHAERLQPQWFSGLNTSDGAAVRSIVSEIDAAFSAEPVLPPQTPDEASDPMNTAVTELQQKLIVALHQRFAVIVDDPLQRVAFAGDVCQRLVDELNQTKELTAERLQQLSRQLEEMPMPPVAKKGQADTTLETLQVYLQGKQCQNALACLKVTADVLQDSLSTIGETLAAFRAGVTSLAQQNAASPSREDRHDTTCPSETPHHYEIRSILEARRAASLVQDIGEAVDQTVQAGYGSLSNMIFQPDVDITDIAKENLAVARHKLLEALVEQRVDAVQPALLSCGGGRRFLVVANEEYERAGLVDLVLQKLPAAATVERHEQREILLLCEAQGLPPRGVAWNIAQFRTELVELSTRLPTRTDIAWSPL